MLSRSVVSKSLQPHVSMVILQARTLEWAVVPSSRGSSQPRDGAQVFRTAGGAFIAWATKEAQTPTA